MEIVLFDRELEVMEVLWDRGSATVAEVRDALPDAMARTTVLTVLRRLVERLTHRLFHGSPELLLTHLLRRQRLSPDELRTLRELVDGELREEEG